MKTRLHSPIILVLALICSFLFGCNKLSNSPGYTDRERLMLDTTDNHTMDIDSLLDFLRKYQKEGNKVREMATYASLGHTYMSSSRYQEAVLSHEKELELAQELNDTLMMATALNDLGTNYRRMSLYYDALEYHSRAIEVATPASGINKQKLMKCQAVGNNGLGNIYMKIGNYARADSALRRALAIETALGSHLGMNVDNSNIGMVFERLGMYDSALIYFQRAYEHSKLSVSKTGLAYCHMHFGRIYQHNKEYDKALYEFHEAMDVINEDIDKWLWLQPCISTAGIYVAINNKEKAQEYLELALSTAQKLGSKEHFAQIYHYYSDFYANQGDYKKALEYNRMSQASSDSLLNSQNMFEIENLEINMARRQNERRVDEQKVLVRLERTQKWLFFLGFIIFAILAGVFWYVSFVRSRNNRMQQEFMNMRERFFTNITHEFRTPLTVILGKSEEMLRNSALSPEQVKDASSMIVKNGKTMLSLVNQLLDISKAKSEIGPQEWRRGDIVPYLKMLVEECQQLAKDKHITMLFACNQEHIMMDTVPDYMHKIFANLITNSIKFTPENGHVNIKCQVNEQNLLETMVVDDGIGIEEENLKHIFDPFFQEARDVKNLGTGVGLSMVNQLVKALHGQIEVESTPGQGTAFTVVIPLTHGDSQWPPFTSDLSETPSAFVSEPVAQEVQLEDSASTAESQPKILIVEDNLDIARFIGEQFPEKYRLYYASNGTEGLKKATSILPDIILTDLMMPGMDGLELCRAIRSNSSTNTIPVIIITAKATQEDLEEGLRAGANAYVFKPFSGKELQIRVNWILSERRMLWEKYQLAQQQVSGMGKELSKDDQAFISKFTNLIYDQMRSVEIDVEALAMELCMSKSTLRRKLTDLTGDSPVNYITKIRIDYAKQLLKGNPDLTINEVGMRCGFSDQAYFSRLFKQQVGVSPLQYRKNLEVIKL